MAGARREAADAYQRALGLLVRREHSRRDLARKLAQRGVEPAEAEAAVERLAGQGYQDDQRFAESFARDRTSAGYGPVRIRVELAGHGLPEDAIQAALAACEADWPALARRQVERRWRPAELADPARRRKAVEFLLRRGFDQGDAWSAVRSAPDEGVDP
ncbi:regulatory protein RecX [Arenimonas caeni]|jgi:regulatory protein|uniref:Regulatory protein RecX n=1 Tax=Arenimonas caeni TaxID=2058085 RepID=A0A2P6MC89_9GAMM|nr:regulatory protein RecX [Arenimonas caeni]MDY0021059.1 regulatory protein RecX [Arenimonas caeni]PRH83605.1 recombination regulator RecX [Arenimonas caeni]